MRKVVMFNRITLDGFFAGPNGEIDRFVQDPEVDQVVHQSMRPDTLLLGRISYEMFAGFWPQVAGDPNMPDGMRQMAAELDQMTKIVFSCTLDRLDWVNSQLISADVTGAVRALRQGDGPDITLFGSGSIVQQLAADKLIDEYLIVVTPVVLGQGKPLFAAVDSQSLTLLAARSFASGNVLLHYQQN